MTYKTATEADAVRQNHAMPPAFFSYPALFESKESMSGQQKYSVQLLIPKDRTSKEALTGIKNAIKAAAFSKFGPDQKKWPAGMHNPLRDGDKEKFDVDPEKYAAYENKWFVNASNSYAPTILKKVKGQARPTDVVKPEEFYPGIVGVAIVDFFGFQAKHKTTGAILNQGISCSLVSVCKIADGPRLGGGGPRDTDTIYADVDLGDGVDESGFEAPEGGAEPATTEAKPATKEEAKPAAATDADDDSWLE